MSWPASERLRVSTSMAQTSLSGSTTNSVKHAHDLARSPVVKCAQRHVQLHCQDLLFGSMASTRTSTRPMPWSQVPAEVGDVARPAPLNTDRHDEQRRPVETLRCGGFRLSSGLVLSSCQSSCLVTRASRASALLLRRRFVYLFRLNFMRSFRLGGRTALADELK